MGVFTCDKSNILNHTSSLNHFLQNFIHGASRLDSIDDSYFISLKYTWSLSTLNNTQYKLKCTRVSVKVFFSVVISLSA